MKKKIINKSKVDSMIEFLTMHDVPFFVIPMVIKQDHYSNCLVPIRRLEFESKVMLEQLVRASDPDDTDMIICQVFESGKEPLDWLTEIQLDNIMSYEIF
jgi:hypothetical protein